MQMIRGAIGMLLTVLLSASAFGQSQAANGTIEGTVTDTSSGVLPGVTVTITNIETGAERSVTTNADGRYRSLLLPLGRYRVVAELPGFKKFDQSGIGLQAGQTGVINVTLEVGAVSEAITVTAEAPVAQPGKIDLGRTLNETEIHNLPLPSRNPYNYAFLQANVTGYENNELGVPRINANGSQMHTNYQLDGNTNTEKDRAGLRLLPISEVLVREVKIVTNGFAPEFGQTTGMVYNAITQSGTNDLHGSASYRFKRNSMSTRTFFLAPTAIKPDTKADDATATLGGPIARNRAHFFGAYEFIDRSLVTAGNVISVKPADATALGITLPGNGVIPAHQKVNFAFGKVDYQAGKSTLVSGRYLLFKNFSLSNINGGLTTTDRSTDFTDRMDSASAQAVTTMGISRLNEFRVQFARRHQFRTIGQGVAGPAITVSGVAQFGGPRIGDTNSVGWVSTQKIWQAIDNYTWIAGSHAVKGGIDAQFIGDDRVAGENYQYTFSTTAAYLAAKSGANPFAYTTLQQTFGDLSLSYDSRFYGVFVQDDWQIASRIKLLYGLRYDLFDIPQSKPFAANPYSNNFTVDKNNIGPRAGLSWSLDSTARTVLRASTGKMFEPPLIDFYDASILTNGDPLRFNANASGCGTPAACTPSVGSPAFPTSLAAPPPGFVLGKQSITAVDTDFRTQSAWLSNVQLERALNTDLSISAGYVNAVGRNLPVLMDINLIPSGQTLADGRPIFSTTRVNPTFDHINVFKSIAESNYNAFVLTLARRMRNGWQAQATYTGARGVDNAPLTSTYVIGSQDDRVSDPINLDRDKGVTPFNQTHTLAVSGVLAPQVSGGGMRAMVLNNNQLAIILQANSGLPFNIRSNADLNADGNSNDRPLNIERNSGRLGNVVNLDLRYSRFVPIGGQSRAEVLVEAKNLFNRQNVSGVNRVVTTDAAGNPIVAIPDPFPGNAGYDQRIIQVGFKVTF
jgi:Carboxypeptidase regulatory-like domain/TonB dependent receptor-like, beta-barrel